MNTHLKHKSIIIVLIVIIALLPTVAFAADSQKVFLKGTGPEFNAAGWQNVFYVNVTSSDDKTYESVWHLEYSDKTNIDQVTSMQITFTNDVVFNWTPDMGFSENAGDNNKGWVIYAPSDYEIDIDHENSFVVTEDMNNVEFNISGYNKGETPPPPPVESGSITLTKKDVDTGKLIDGAVFALTDNAGDTVTKEAINGVAAWSDLTDGTYVITETQAADGYDITSYQLYQNDVLIPDNTVTVNADTLDLELVATNSTTVVPPPTPVTPTNDDTDNNNIAGQDNSPTSVQGESSKTIDAFSAITLLISLALVALCGALIALYARKKML